MSAYMVSKVHIDLIVSVALNGPSAVPVRPGHWYRPYFKGLTLGFEQLNDLGEMLVKENLSSIHARYPDTLENPDATPGPCEQYWLQPYEHTERHYRLTPVEALNALACYEYQSCEHPEWEASEAREFCERLRHTLISVLPGYNDSPWEWTEEEVQKRRLSLRRA